MINENLGEKEIIFKEVEGAGVIKGLDMGKEKPRIIEFGDNPNKELVEDKENKEEYLIDSLNKVIETFQEIRAKYSKENFPSTSNEDKMRLNESREVDNNKVKAFIEEIDSLKMNLTTEREKGRIDEFKKRMIDFYDTNKGS